MLATHPHLLRGLLSGAISLIPLYAFVEWRRKTVYPPLPLLRPRHKIDDNIKEIGWVGIGYELGVSCFESGDEPLVSINCCTFLN